jgi:hypothetical protein
MCRLDRVGLDILLIMARPLIVITPRRFLHLESSQAFAVRSCDVLLV